MKVYLVVAYGGNFPDEFYDEILEIYDSYDVAKQHVEYMQGNGIEFREGLDEEIRIEEHVVNNFFDSSRVKESV